MLIMGLAKLQCFFRDLGPWAGRQQPDSRDLEAHGMAKYVWRWGWGDRKRVFSLGDYAGQVRRNKTGSAEELGSSHSPIYSGRLLKTEGSVEVLLPTELPPPPTACPWIP